jgi:ribosomal protein S18 acetylase RimI-like enzyme
VTAGVPGGPALPDLPPLKRSAPIGGAPMERTREAGIELRPIAEDDPAEMAFQKTLFALSRPDDFSQAPFSRSEFDLFIAQQFHAQHVHYRKYYPDGDFLTLWKEGVRIGRLYHEIWPSQHRLIDIAFMPALRGQGLGSAVMHDLLDAAAAQGKKVGLHVEKWNRAHGLYRRLGFEIIEEKDLHDYMEWSA